MEQSSIHSTEMSPATLKLPGTAPIMLADCLIGRRQIVAWVEVKFSEINGTYFVGGVYTPGVKAVLDAGKAPAGEPGVVSMSVTTSPTVLYLSSVPVAPPAAVLYRLKPVAPVTAIQVTVTVDVE